jgi:hypothetical protein
MVCITGATHAQDETGRVLNLMQQLAATYKNIPQLSFDVMYKYASEAAPDNYQDSLNGHFKLSGNRFWYDMDNTEAICTGDYLIMLFKEDNVMYLAKPSTMASQSTVNPLAMLDSFLVNNKNVACHLTQQQEQQVITLDFTGDGPCKKVEYYINKKTGLLVKTVNVVRAEQLYEAPARPLIEGATTYAIVEASYNNYQQGGFDNSVFDYNRYFKKQGTEYTTVTPFDSYKIFLGTPNL